MKIQVDIDEEYYSMLKYEVDILHNDYKPIVLIANGKPIEPLTDIEQRIFLAAMGREKEICKKEDKWDNRANLVLVCGRITSKVRAALWQ